MGWNASIWWQAILFGNILLYCILVYKTINFYVSRDSHNTGNKCDPNLKKVFYLFWIHVLQVDILHGIFLGFVYSIEIFFLKDWWNSTSFNFYYRWAFKLFDSTFLTIYRYCDQKCVFWTLTMMTLRSYFVWLNWLNWFREWKDFKKRCQSLITVTVNGQKWKIYCIWNLFYAFNLKNSTWNTLVQDWLYTYIYRDLYKVRFYIYFSFTLHQN
jgi:hypothetical protein